MSSSNPVSGAVQRQSSNQLMLDYEGKKNWKLSESRLSALHHSTIPGPASAPSSWHKDNQTNEKPSGQIISCPGISFYFLFVFFVFLKPELRARIQLSRCRRAPSVDWAGGRLLHVRDALFYLTERLINLMWHGSARQCCKCHSTGIQHKPQ